MEDFEKYDINYNKEADMFAIQDLLNQEIIILRTEQLEELIKLWCNVFNRRII